MKLLNWRSWRQFNMEVRVPDFRFNFNLKPPDCTRPCFCKATNAYRIKKDRVLSAGRKHGSTSDWKSSRLQPNTPLVPSSLCSDSGTSGRLRRGKPPLYVFADICYINLSKSGLFSSYYWIVSHPKGNVCSLAYPHASQVKPNSSPYLTASARVQSHFRPFCFRNYVIIVEALYSTVTVNRGTEILYQIQSN